MSGQYDTENVHMLPNAELPLSAAPTAPAAALATGDGDGHSPGMADLSERMAKLEGSFDGLKGIVEGLRHSQNLTLGATVSGFTIVVAVMLALGVYTLQRIDNLPSEFNQLNNTLANAIAAARSNPPQVILLPAPVAPQATPTKP